MPSVIFIAGPNGAGKTTFSDEYLSAEERKIEFVNADEMARGLESHGRHRLSDIAAARMMLNRIEDLVQAEADFIVESTLATLTYARNISAWRKRGYIVSIAYLRLSSVEESIARVRKRVAAGGHSIPEETIYRRFERSLLYFETIYKPIVDEWYIWESREGAFVLVDAWNRN